MNVIEKMAKSWTFQASFFALEENAPPVNAAQFVEMMKAMAR